jgi:hypothetical protein
MIALRTRSRASFTVVSGRPTIVKPGRPLLMCTSTVINGAQTPSAARVNNRQRHNTSLWKVSMGQIDFTFPKKEGLRAGFHTFSAVADDLFFSGILLACYGLVPKSPFSVEKNEIISFQFFFIKNKVFIDIVLLTKKNVIKKSCVMSHICDNSLGIPSNMKPESTENDSPSTSD